MSDGTDDTGKPGAARQAILDRIHAAQRPEAPRVEPAKEAGKAPPRDAPPAGARASSDAPSDITSQMGGARPESSDKERSAPGDDGSGGRGNGDVGGSGEIDWDFECSLLPLTDLGNAQRFVLRHGDEFLFCAQWGWLAWDGRRWTRDRAEGLLARAIHDTVTAIGNEAIAYADSGEDCEVDVKKGKAVYRSDQIAGWGHVSQGSSHVGCIKHLSQPYIEAQVADFDTDPMALNVENGTLRFRIDPDGGDTVTLTRHNRADRITKLAPVVYDPEAPCPVYDEALAYVQPADHMRRHLHCWGGISSTGDVSIQRLAFWYGKGRNMKSTVLNAWAHVLGDYAATTAIESFLDQGRTKRGGEPTPDLAKLAGIRLLRTTEPERGAKLAEALIKTVTGEEGIPVRELNMPFFDLTIQFTLTIFGNTKPRIDGTDDGIWRRVLLVPWERQVPEDMIDRALPEKLKKEASGILNRLLDGIRDYLDNGLALPDEVSDATADYRVESDPLGQFMDVCVDYADGARIQSTDLYRLYVAWCIANGEKHWTAQGFGRAMGERGYKRKRSNVVFWLDLKLTKRIHDFVENGNGDIKSWRPIPAEDQEKPKDPDDDVPL